jgi:hypothetical protein
MQIERSVGPEVLPAHPQLDASSDTVGSSQWRDAAFPFLGDPLW